MSGIRSRHPRQRLGPTTYAALHQQILIRDGWRCQNCGAAERLEVHHLQRRSLLGDDSEANLITLCAKCHWLAHHGKRTADHD